LIDADGLNALAPFDIQGSDEFPLILTPHIGEMRRLLGVDEKADLSDRVKVVREFAQNIMSFWF
jgi:NAD(P)H-hydrate repair Nnr-like enzyme with NAD(P)H-hydrate dehydratase domain